MRPPTERASKRRRSISLIRWRIAHPILLSYRQMAGPVGAEFCYGVWTLLSNSTGCSARSYKPLGLQARADASAAIIKDVSFELKPGEGLAILVQAVPENHLWQDCSREWPSLPAAREVVGDHLYLGSRTLPVYVNRSACDPASAAKRAEHEASARATPSRRAHPRAEVAGFYVPRGWFLRRR